ncbi:MAG: BMP family protein [Bacillota bacterium]
MLKRIVSIVLCLMMLFACLAATACSAPAANGDSTATQAPQAAATEPPAEKKLKIAMICSGAINDGSWNTSGYNGLMAIGEKYGAETAYSEQVSIDELPTVLRSYGREGFDIIIAHSMEYDEQMKRIAPEFPDTKFVTVNGFSTGDNLYAVQFKYWELQYFVGLAAGLVSKTGQVADIAAMETEMTKMEIQALQQGAAYANAACVAKISYTGDWNDLAKAKEASLAQIADGSDVLEANVSSATSAILGACQEKGAYCIGWGNDISSMDPKTVVVSALFGMEGLYTITAEMLMNGTSDRNLLLSMRDGAMSMTKMADWVPQDKKDIFDQRLADYLAGKFDIKVEGALQ